MMSRFLIFTDNVNSVAVPDATFVRMDGSVANKRELFQEFCEKLHFPDYFGENWDAFNDCLCSLDDWLVQPNLVLIYEQMPNLPYADMTIFIEILYDYIIKKYVDTPYQIWCVFPEGARNLCTKIIQEMEHR
jgi:RNAse (barnase) inhibitor barstar